MMLYTGDGIAVGNDSDDVMIEWVLADVEAGECKAENICVHLELRRFSDEEQKSSHIACGLSIDAAFVLRDALTTLINQSQRNAAKQPANGSN